MFNFKRSQSKQPYTGIAWIVASAALHMSIISFCCIASRTCVCTSTIGISQPGMHVLRGELMVN